MSNTKNKFARGQLEGLRFALKESGMAGVNISDLRQGIAERIQTIESQIVFAQPQSIDDDSGGMAMIQHQLDRY